MGNRQIIDSREKLIRELGDILGMSNNEMTPYVDLTSQTIDTHVPQEYTDSDEDEELRGHEIVDIEPVSSREGYEAMQRFALQRQDMECDKLLKALSRRRPFANFRSAVEYLGILQEWYAFKKHAYEALAEERLNDECLDVVDGKIIRKQPIFGQDLDEESDGE
jgi:hypothetical protein